jgi:hypothetical protein
MYAVCKAFEHYGRVDPDDKWLPAFQCYDGLIIEKADAVPHDATSGGAGFTAGAEDDSGN